VSFEWNQEPGAQLIKFGTGAPAEWLAELKPGVSSIRYDVKECVCVCVCVFLLFFVALLGKGRNKKTGLIAAV